MGMGLGLGGAGRINDGEMSQGSPGGGSHAADPRGNVEGRRGRIPGWAGDEWERIQGGGGTEAEGVL